MPRRAFRDQKNMDRHFQVFKFSALSWAKWRGGRAIYVLNNRETSTVFESRKNKKHPEESMLEELVEKLPDFKSASLKITVYQNCSPCRSCSDKYVDFVGRARQHNIQLDLTIIFVALYNIQRPSRNSSPSLSEKEHQDNLNGLLLLCGEKVELKSFDFDDWCKLSECLDIWPEWTSEEYESSDIQKHNEAIVKDLDTLLGTTDEDDDDESSSENDVATSLRMSQRPTNEEKFAIFWKSGLQKDGGKGARCLYICGACGPSPLFENQSPEEHAEHFLLPHLEQHLEQHLSEPHPPRIEVTVYQNLSPCGDCCTRYRRQAWMKRSLKVSIVFATFYNINRPTCSLQVADPRHHDKNLQGLGRLRDEGVRLRSFTFYDWLELAQLLQATPKTEARYVNSGRKGEDDSMVKDMETLRLLPSGQTVQAGGEAAAARSGQAAAWERLSLGVEDLKLALADTVGRAVAQKIEEVVPLELKKGAQAAALEAGRAVTREISSVKQTMGEEVSKAVSRQMEATGRDTARLLQDAVTRELKTSVMPSIQEKVAAELVAKLPEAVQAGTAGLLEVMRAAARSSMVEEGFSRQKARLSGMEAQLSELDQRQRRTEKQNKGIEEGIKLLTDRNKGIEEGIKLLTDRSREDADASRATGLLVLVGLFLLVWGQFGVVALFLTLVFVFSNTWFTVRLFRPVVREEPEVALPHPPSEEEADFLQQWD